MPAVLIPSSANVREDWPKALTAARREKSPKRHEAWQIFINTLNSRTYRIDAYPHMLVDELFLELDKKERVHGCSATGCRLIYGGKQLELYRMLSDYGIHNESTIHLVLRLNGGTS